MENIHKTVSQEQDEMWKRFTNKKTIVHSSICYMFTKPFLIEKSLIHSNFILNNFLKGFIFTQYRQNVVPLKLDHKSAKPNKKKELKPKMKKSYFDYS